MEYRRPSSSDFDKIVALQNSNLASALKQSEQLDGFLTASFSAQQFQAMDNDLCVVVCTEAEQMIGYACASSVEYNKSIPLIATMLKYFPMITYKNKSLATYHSFIYGPVCIDKGYRGKGILHPLFKKILEFLLHEHQQLELLTTLISIENTRSLNAHEKLSMEIVGQFEFNEKAFCILVFPINKQ